MRSEPEPETPSVVRHAPPAPPSRGCALVFLGVLGLVRAWLVAAPPPSPWEAGEAVPLRVEALAGDEFRLLPGVGEVLAERLEAARTAAGGRLTEDALARVSGVGPALRKRWAALRPR